MQDPIPPGHGEPERVGNIIEHPEISWHPFQTTVIIKVKPPGMPEKSHVVNIDQYGYVERRFESTDMEELHELDIVHPHPENGWELTTKWLMVFSPVMAALGRWRSTVTPS
jgi:hypothetical protein